MIVYGFFYNSCIFESAPGLQSLHLTKAGAYKAMRADMIKVAMEDRENSPYKSKGWTKEKPIDWRSWSIKKLEVQDE